MSVMHKWKKESGCGRANKDMLVKGYKLPDIISIIYGDLMYSVVAIVNSLKESILNICPEKRKKC